MIREIYVISRVQTYSYGYRSKILRACNSKEEAEVWFEAFARQFEFTCDPRNDAADILMYGYPKNDSNMFYTLERTYLK